MFQISNRARQSLAGEFECPVCNVDMSSNGIFACSNDHWICRACVGHDTIAGCPSCAEEFAQREPTRCYTAERVADIARQHFVSQSFDREYECPVCTEDLSSSSDCGGIFACSNDHWICGACLGHDAISRCPSCAEDFADREPRRCYTAERIGDVMGKLRERL